MTILPNCSKKKTTQGSSSAEIEKNDGTSNSSHIPNLQLSNLASIPVSFHGLYFK